MPPVYRLPNGPVTVTRWDKKKGKTEAVVGPTQKGWISTKRVSRHVLHAIIASEDGKFYQHHGIDWESTVDSAKYNWQKGRYARGASTISQQVVKMAFLEREKTLIRKAREAVGVVLMESLLAKDQILEWYINLAEFGDGVYGINDGSWHYFKTKPELLTIEQAVHLALVLPSPNVWSRGLRNRQLSKFGHKRYAAILNNLKNSGYITKTQWLAALGRGDFGRPIAGFESLVAAEESHKELCPGSPGCPEDENEGAWDEESEQVLTFPDKAKGQVASPVETPQREEPAPGAGAPTGASSPGAVGASSPGSVGGLSPGGGGGSPGTAGKSSATTPESAAPGAAGPASTGAAATLPEVPNNLPVTPPPPAPQSSGSAPPADVVSPPAPLVPGGSPLGESPAKPPP